MHGFQRIANAWHRRLILRRSTQTWHLRVKRIGPPTQLIPNREATIRMRAVGDAEWTVNMLRSSGGHFTAQLMVTRTRVVKRWEVD